MSELRDLVEKTLFPEGDKTNYNKIIDGYFYMTNPAYARKDFMAILMCTGSGGARDLYRVFQAEGKTDDEIGNIIGIALKNNIFIPLRDLIIKVKQDG